MDKVVKNLKYLNIRDKKNLKLYEKKALPHVQKALRWGITATILTMIILFVALLATYLIMIGCMFCAGVVVAGLAVLLFANQLMFDHVKGITKATFLFRDVIDLLIDALLLFGMVVYFYANNYPLMLMTVVLAFVMAINVQILVLAKKYKLKLTKIDYAFTRIELYICLVVGLLLPVFSLAVAVALLAALLTMVAYVVVAIRPHRYDQLQATMRALRDDFSLVVKKCMTKRK